MKKLILIRAADTAWQEGRPSADESRIQGVVPLPLSEQGKDSLREMAVVIRGEKPADFLHKDESLVVFKDIYPHAPVHLLVVPRKHIRSINEVTGEDREIIYQMIVTGKDMAKEQGIHRAGYKLLFNVERGGGQVIFHVHLHLLGGWQ